MALDSLTLNGSAPVNWTASKNVTGAEANQNNSTATEARASIGTAAANNAANGANELYFALLSVAANSSTSIDLNSFTDILGATGIQAVRTKFIQVELLSAAQDSTNGTNATSITIDGTVSNALLSQSNSGWLANNTSSFVIPNGCWMQFGCPNAAGVAVDNTHKVIKITNNDGAVAAAVKVIAAVGTT